MNKEANNLYKIFWGIAFAGLLYYFYQRGKRLALKTQPTTDTNVPDPDLGGEPEPDNSGNQGARLFGTPPSAICVEPTFATNIGYSGSYCAGQYINESKVLRKGMFGCDVLLMQQRLNSIQTSNILPPTGKFDCNTLSKLKNIKGVDSITLNSFQPDEEIGFDSIRPTTVKNPNYSYMDVDKQNYK